MSLFTELLRLHGARRPTEDFFTEIVAALLSRERHLAREWLSAMGVAGLECLSLTRVETQVALPSTDEAGDSRPDLYLKLAGPGRSVVVLVESKVGSKERDGQLQTYATHLSSIESVDCCWLIYVTRDYDPKSGPKVGSEPSVRFEQSRWATFFNVLERHKGDHLVDETLSFMKEQGMQRIDRIQAKDILAIRGMPRALAFMDEVLAGAVSRLSTDPPWLPSDLSVRWSDVRLKDRYVISHDLKPKLTLLFGFLFDVDGEDPRLEVMVEAAPSIENRQAVLQGLQGAAIGGGPWKSYNMDGASAWSGIRATQGMLEHLGHESHLRSMQDFLVDRVNDVREMGLTNDRVVL